MNIAIDNPDYAMSEVPHWEEYMEQKDEAVKVANAPDPVTGRTSEASRASSSARDPRDRVPDVPPNTSPIGDVEALKKDIKKLNAQATNLKMNLHDLAEDLPIGWEKIPEVAAQAYEAYKNLTEARSRLAASGG